MMNTNLLTGKLVRLQAVDPKTMAEAFSRWGRNSEYDRLMNTDPAIAHSVKSSTKWMEEHLDKAGQSVYMFGIHTLSDGELIGDMGLDLTHWAHRDAFVGISIGEPANWGKGYGTDAMQVMLRYAFDELNLHRVTLNVFSYNPRAIRSYEKAGFVHEGSARSWLHREGKRWDLVYMGILREEWEAQQDRP